MTALLSTLWSPAHAAPPTAASDTAQVVWRSGPVAGNTLTCGADAESTGCHLDQNTIQAAYPCVSETIQAANLQPVLTYSNTFCTASLHGRLPGATDRGVCDITSLLGLQVSFDSGVNAAFDGDFFPVGAIFTPTAFSGSSVTAGTLKVVDSAPLAGSLGGTGHISAVFDVVFTTPLAASCRSGKGYLRPVGPSTIVVRN